MPDKEKNCADADKAGHSAKYSMIRFIVQKYRNATYRSSKFKYKQSVISQNNSKNV
jgi:hypothetical protein